MKSKIKTKRIFLDVADTSKMRYKFTNFLSGKILGWANLAHKNYYEKVIRCINASI